MAFAGPRNRVGPQGEQGPIGPIGPVGPQGPIGPAGVDGEAPAHEWRDSELRFQKPNGKWGIWTNLRGKRGPPGPPGTEGAPGADGAVGPQGPQGDPGPQGPPGTFEDYGDKFNFHVASLAAFDKVVDITHLDAGLRTQRISVVEMSSTTYPNANMTKTVFYLDVGSMNQRIEKVEYSGTILSPDSLRKVFQYSLSGIRYKLDGFYYELF